MQAFIIPEAQMQTPTDTRAASARPGMTAALMDRGKELDANGNVVGRWLDRSRRGPVPLLFAAEDREHNQAVVLRNHLAGRLDS